MLFLKQQTTHTTVTVYTLNKAKYELSTQSLQRVIKIRYSI